MYVLIGSIHVTVPPSSENNHQRQRLETEATSLGYKLSGVILQHLQIALNSPETMEILNPNEKTRKTVKR